MHENVFPGGMPVEGKRGNYIALAATLAALGALLLCSQAALESARAGLNLCAQMIVPSLLPFFILSSLLQQLGLPGILGRWLSPVTQRLFGIGGAGASALLLGVTGGYPLGADAVARLRRSGTLTREQAERALAFCNNSGPAFLVGAAGVGVFHSAGYGLLLYGVHVLSAVIVGMLFAPRSGGFPPEERAQIAAVSLSQALPEAVRSAVRAVLTVSGFVVTFSVVTGVLDASGLLPALVGTLAARLGLDLSEWCDVVIGDYNYLFDPVVHLKRFFDAAGDWLFLIDEAHNLPDRARAMYSAQFAKSSLTEAKRALGKGKSSLKTALTKADKVFLAARKACAQAAPRAGTEPAGETEPAQVSLLPAEAAPDFALPEPLYARDGTVFLQQLPAALPAALRAVHTPLQDWLEQNPEDPAHAQLLELYFALQDIARAADRYDSHFVTQLTARGSELELHLLCLDPAPFVDASLAAGRSAALFSATLTPPAFYRNVLGCADARAVALPSPFPPENLGLFCLPGISTRYRQREASVPAVADALAALAKGKTGNYLAFFPSYAYLQQVYEAFAARWPDIPTLVQQRSLDDAGRAEFLAQFVPRPAQTLLGFAVMGGIFGEGVDLVGDRLIGCAIVGVGLPQVNPRQEMLRRYYDAQNGAGFDYAYRWPGMNKVLQAAGRVIRTQEDKGVVLLLDDRFAQSEYARLFPKHWRHLEYLRDTKELKKKLAEFWGTH